MKLGFSPLSLHGNDKMKNMKEMRREYGKNDLLESQVNADPFEQFNIFLNRALTENLIDANYMVISTVSTAGFPDSRVVLLKEYNNAGFVFFTDYTSQKALDIESNNKVALNFYWAALATQVRIKGIADKTSVTESQQYFASRPRESQLVTVASEQSHVLANREVLESKVKELSLQFADKEIPCPITWGGYRVIPFEFEFFQGRDNRMNDRIRYLLLDGQWKIERLSP